MTGKMVFKLIGALIFAIMPLATLNAASELNEMKIQIKIGEHTLKVKLADNSSVKALTDLLKKSEVTVEMSDYAGMEKVGLLPITLPRNDVPLNTSAGDVILYQGNHFVIYYGTNSWSLTPIGKIEGFDGKALYELLGPSDVTVKLTLVDE